MTTQEINKNIANKLWDEFIDVRFKVEDHYRMVLNILERPEYLEKEVLKRETKMASKLLKRKINLNLAIASLSEFILERKETDLNLLNKRINKAKLISRIIYGGELK
tara:strand:+ start:931 stop:1251 length:321 start_codon:yes stop_codon:yes gene_type:complete